MGGEREGVRTGGRERYVDGLDKQANGRMDRWRLMDERMTTNDSLILEALGSLFRILVYCFCGQKTYYRNLIYQLVYGKSGFVVYHFS